MVSSDNYRGSSVFIHDKDGSEIACTRVIKHDIYHGTIIVEKIYKEMKNEESVTVLIVTGSGAHEYQGKLRKSIDNPTTMEIALFQGQVQTRRSALRYPINKAAMVHNLVVNEELIPLLNPLEILIVNLSTSGVLIRAKPNDFALDTAIAVKLRIGENVTMIYCCIVRLRNIDKTTVEYGCKFIPVS